MPSAELAGSHDLPIVEDAAQAIGSSWNGKVAGTLGDVATFSFHGTKTVTTGEGGMLVTDRADLFERVARLARSRAQAERPSLLRHR